jgi:hypothetical protein
MKHYFSVTFKVTFGLMAESQQEAEELAKEMLPIDDLKSRMVHSVDAYFTPNQSQSIRFGALNYDDDRSKKDNP